MGDQRHGSHPRPHQHHMSGHCATRSLTAVSSLTLAVLLQVLQVATSSKIWIIDDGDDPTFSFGFKADFPVMLLFSGGYMR